MNNLLHKADGLVLFPIQTLNCEGASMRLKTATLAQV
jgi:hypothetical protein